MSLTHARTIVQSMGFVKDNLKPVKFCIEDWAGNVMNSKGRFERPELSVPKQFNSFEDAWGWIYENIKNEENWQDLSVEVM